jgi:exosortase
MHPATLSPGPAREEPEQPIHAAPSTGGWRIPVALLLLAAVWGRLLYGLTFEWEFDPQYAHGWFIPILTGILVATRWGSTPEPQPSRLARWISAGVLIPVVLLTPLAFLQAVYPEARPFQWAHAGLVAAITFAGLALYGGWAWVRHFAFPVFFLLLAVPWPRSFQQEVTSALMSGVASTTVELSLLAGIPARQQGNTIGLAESTVGVDEACSGVRSLQGSMIIGLFLGSYFPMAALPRVALVVLCLAGSLLLNVVRASTLTWISATSGSASVGKYHDPAGFIILAGVFVGALAVAHVFSRRWGLPEAPLSQAAPASSWPGARALGVPAMLGLLWLGATDLSRLLYFGPIPHSADFREWQVDPHRAEGIVTDAAITPAARQFLRYDSGQSKIVEQGNGTVVRLVELEWRGGELSAAGARLHTPAICLPTLGYTLEQTLPPLALSIHGIDSRFAGLVFRTGDRTAYVYHALWENGRAIPPGESAGDQSLSSAVQAVRERRRLSRARVLLFMLTGPEDATAAGADLAAFLDRVMIVPTAVAHHGRLR